MAATVSDEFKALWQKKVGLVQRRRIAVWRRYYNGAAFVHEAAPTYLYEQDFINWGTIPNQLDSPEENVNQMVVMTLQLENLRNQWVQSSGTPSFFAADDTATDGYRLFKTLFQLQVGYELSDGTIEWVAVFTGYALGNKLSTERGTAEIQVASKSAFLLEKSQAAQVCTTFTLEDCTPAADGVIYAFKSASTGVGAITDVQVNAVSASDTDYSVGNLNVVADPNSDGKATITFKNEPGVVPPNLATVKCSGIKWLQAQDIKALLALIATNAGIDSGDQLLDAVLVPGGAPSSKTIDTQADWQAGTLTNMSATITPGSIENKWHRVDDFSDGNLTTDPVWTVTNVTAAVVASRANITHVGAVHGYIYTELAKTTGTWEWKFTFTSGIGFDVQMGFCDGYALYWRPNPLDVGGGVAQLVHAGTLTAVTGSSPFALTGTGEKTYRVTKTPEGVMKVYVGGVLKDTTAADTATTTGSIFIFDFTGLNGGIAVDFDVSFGDIYFSDEIDGVTAVSALVATFVSATQNILSIPSAYGTLDRTETLNGGTILYETDSSVDGSAWDGYVAISAAGVILSTLRQYFRIRVTITRSSASAVSPQCHKLVANFSTTSIFVSLAILDGMTGADAFQRFAALVDYQTGDNGEGKRFLRSKVVSGSPVVELTQENAIISVIEFDPGHDDVYTVGLVRFGDSFKQYDAASAGAASPTPEDEYGRVVADIDLSGTLLANDADLATARARLLYERRSVAKRRIRMIIHPVPWLETGDMVGVTILESPILGHVVANDPIPRVNSVLSLGSPDALLANGLRMRALEYKPDYDVDTAELYAEEIL